MLYLHLNVHVNVNQTYKSLRNKLEKNKKLNLY
jgi:hypothetical protein